MNVHHLELFYHVARCRGITAAVRQMPYAIQQPAVSGQILQLERALGVKLFNRRPFALTSEGAELYRFVNPFFSRLAEVEARLKGEERHHLRLAAATAALTLHLPEILAAMRREVPELRLTLKAAAPGEIDALLNNQEVDVAISVIPPDLAPGVKATTLLELPLVLLAPPGSKAKSLEALVVDDPGGWGKKISEPLIGLVPNDLLTQRFQRELEKRRIAWDTRVEVTLLELVRRYVADGFGFGLSVRIPGMKAPDDGVREIPLRGFLPLPVGVLHTGSLKPLAEVFVQVVTARAKKLGREAEGGRGKGR